MDFFQFTNKQENAKENYEKPFPIGNISKYDNNKNWRMWWNKL